VELIDQLLSEGLPGSVVDNRKLAKKVPQAWRIWRSNNAQWAIFPIIGEHLSDADQKGVSIARKNRLEPVFVALNYAAIKAISPQYRRLRPHLVCNIAGRGHLIPPPHVPRRSKTLQPPCATRVPRDLLVALLAEHEVSGEMLKSLRKLEKRYRSLRRRRSDSDQREEEALLQYAGSVLDQMGLRKDRIKGAQMVRTIERGGMGAGRDHFFHSFQNYFLGLLPVLRLRSYFELFKGYARLQWDVNPSDVWFLTALWHDVGYPFEHIGKIVNSAIGIDLPDETETALKESFLQRAETIDALRTLSSLIAHLLEPGRRRTQWMRPGPKSNLGQCGNRIHDALSVNLRKSHGAFGAVRLFCDYSDDLEKMEPSARDLLLQTVWLASCSIPFHDWSFRGHVRSECGDCQIATATLPFAALLAFVDSIQDDRRDLAGSEKAALILEQLLVKEPALVKAKINIHALTDEQLLGKIVEARDVLASLQQNEDSLFFQYPPWMAL
jgi:hypothetical protein